MPTMETGSEAAPVAPADLPTSEDGAGNVRAQAARVDSGWLDGAAEATGISRRALEAYAGTELWAAREYPDCGLRWNTVAGIGAIESRHGTIDGNELRADGSTAENIIGVALDGSEGLAEIHDTDGGVLDGDVEFDRAVGPMQFLPESWALYGRDGNGDGWPDPQNIDDAAASAAVHLCRSGEDLGTDDGWVESVLSYNQSREYVRDVNARASEYAMAVDAE